MINKYHWSSLTDKPTRIRIMMIGRLLLFMSRRETDWTNKRCCCILLFRYKIWSAPLSNLINTLFMMNNNSEQASADSTSGHHCVLVRERGFGVCSNWSITGSQLILNNTIWVSSLPVSCATMTISDPRLILYLITPTSQEDQFFSAIIVFLWNIVSSTTQFEQAEVSAAS